MHFSNSDSMEGNARIQLQETSNIISEGPRLYSVTLQKSTAINCAVYGNFSSHRAHEVVVSRCKVLELLRADAAGDGKMSVVCSTEAFGIIRSLASLRLVGAQRDLIVVGSDSGRIVVLEFSREKGQWVKLHQETYGKTGCRRIVPGEYLAVEPAGRALMIGAIEKQKFAYIFNRDSQNRLTISSPLEAHKQNTIVTCISALDTGYDNPIFASLEVTCAEDDLDNQADGDDDEGSQITKTLSIYELDLGVNHVSLKVADPIEESAHALIPVPGGREGPGGVIVCCEGALRYRKVGHPEVACAIPRRLEMPNEKGLMVVSHATHKMKDFFFVLIQSEYGDLYKVNVSHSEGIVASMTVQYFDTIPVCNALCVLKTGFLFAASEFANHVLYKFAGVGDDPSDSLCSSTDPNGVKAYVGFSPRPLKNLAVFDEMPSMAPITSMMAVDATGEGQSCNLYALCGRGHRSSLRILKHGVAVENRASSELPGKPSGLWTLKETYVPPGQDGSAVSDKYIVVSFADVTLVLEVGESVEECTTTGLQPSAPTLHVAVMADSSKIQVLPDRIRHVMKTRVNEWRVAQGKTITCADSNERQIVVALSGGEITYLEVDETHTLQEISRKELGVEVSCISVQPLPLGRVRSNYCAVGLVDNAVRVLSIERERPLRQLSAQVQKDMPESVCINDLRASALGATKKGGDLNAEKETQNLVLCVGLNDGHVVRMNLDPISGGLSDTRAKFLGARGVSLKRMRVDNGRPAILCMSSKPWVCFLGPSGPHLTPLCFDQLDYVAPFSNEFSPDGFVAISAGNMLRILSLDKVSGHNSMFSQSVVPLTYTPRKMLAMPPVVLSPDVAQRIMLAIIESDHNAYNEETRSAIKKLTAGKKEEGEEETPETEDEERKDGTDLNNIAEAQVGSSMAGKNKWGSCLRVIDPLTASTVFKLDFDVDECATAITTCYFMQLKNHRPCLVVGTSTRMSLQPRSASQSFIKTYLYDENYKLQLIHSTPVEAPVLAMYPFKGRLLASLSDGDTAIVRLYELGKKQLLRKCEYKNLPAGIMWFQCKEDKIYAADLREGFHVFKYRQQSNQLYVLADETVPRWTTCADILDPNTMIGGDKFDNIWVSRLPRAAKDDETGDYSGLRLKGDTDYITGNTHKLSTLASFHVGEAVSSLQRVTLSLGASEVILYSTLQGSIGALYPFLSRREHDLLQSLEMHMRVEMPPLCGRDHQAFRSFYMPVKNVIDGDLCEQFGLLPTDIQKKVATELDKSPQEILKKLEEIRNRIM